MFIQCLIHFRSVMVWSGDKDLMMLKEMATEGVLRQKQKSRERGAAWHNVADNMKITARSVQRENGKRRKSNR